MKELLLLREEKSVCLWTTESLIQSSLKSGFRGSITHR